MKSHEGLSDPQLLQLFVTLLAQNRVTTADLIAVMAEIDDRKLYLPAGYESMHAFCVGACCMSEDEADNGSGPRAPRAGSRRSSPCWRKGGSTSPRCSSCRAG